MIWLLIQGIFVIVCINQQVYASAISDEIVNLVKQNQKLDEEIIESTKFELSKQKKSIHKIILKDESNHLWLFKNYNSSIPVNNSIAVYYLSCLFGIHVPPIYEINLPINGKMVYGSVQRFIDNTRKIKGVLPRELSKKQIELLQLHQILDYFACNPDAGSDNYLIKLKEVDDFLLDIQKEDIIAVDKDDSFYKILSSPYDIWDDNEPYYYRLWNAYIKKEVDIDFTGGIQLIGYIQSIGVKKIEQLLSPFFCGRETFLNSVLSRTSKLKITFGRFYQKLANKRGQHFRYQVNIKEEEKYAQIVLKKIGKIVLKKKEWLKILQSRQNKKQKNIEVIFCPEVFNKARSLEDVSRTDIAVKLNKLLNKVKTLRRNNLSVHEKFALSLYIYDIEDISRKRPLEYFLRKPIENIVMSSDDIDVCSWEYTLRTFYKLPRQISGKILKKFDYRSRDILKHLNFIQCPIAWDERKIIFEEYKKQIGYDSLVKFIRGMLFNEIEYLEQIEDNFSWKYLGKGMIYWLYEDWDKAMQEYQKAIILSNDRGVTFFGYRVLGFIYEHNDQRVRFGEGFGVDNAIKNYKKALEINSDSMEVRLNLASLYLIKQLSAEALQNFKEIQKIDYKYAREHFHFKNIKKISEYKTKKDYLEAVKMNTLSGEHHYVLGLAYAVKGQNEMAKKHFKWAKKFGYKVDVNLEGEHI